MRHTRRVAGLFAIVGLCMAQLLSSTVIAAFEQHGEMLVAVDGHGMAAPPSPPLAALSSFVDPTADETYGLGALSPSPPPPPPWPPPVRRARPTRRSDAPSAAKAVAAPLPAAQTTAAGAASTVAAVASAGGAADGTPVVLHKSARRWLTQCAEAAVAHLAATLPSSEYWRQRKFFLFYRHLYCILSRYAPSATSVLDVGSAIPPYVNALRWVARRTILGPRFAGNVAKGGAEMFSLARIESKFNVSAVQADFLTWQPPAQAAAASARPMYDLVLCTEVVEHIAQPREFVRKLLQTGRTVVLSVPYKWGKCDTGRKYSCHHLQNHITREKIAGWAGRPPSAYDVVEEPKSGERRIICVYLQS